MLVQIIKNQTSSLLLLAMNRPDTYVSKHKVPEVSYNQSGQKWPSLTLGALVIDTFI